MQYVIYHFLHSVKIEGDIPGFEVTVSDEKVVTILKIVTSLQLPPPSLANTTTYYDDIPVTESSVYITVCCYTDSHFRQVGATKSIASGICTVHKIHFQM